MRRDLLADVFYAFLVGTASAASLFTCDYENETVDKFGLCNQSGASSDCGSCQPISALEDRASS